MLAPSKKIKTLPVDYLWELFEPNFTTGVLVWKRRPVGHFKSTHSCNIWNAYNPGVVAGSVTQNGYIIIGVSGKFYTAHRIIFAMANRAWPAQDIDHINGVKSDNRIKNLREVSKSQNSKNRRLGLGNRSGVMGVFWDSNAKKWRAYISENGKTKILGYFSKKDDAILCRMKALVDLGYHENHGQSCLNPQNSTTENSAINNWSTVRVNRLIELVSMGTRACDIAEQLNAEFGTRFTYNSICSQMARRGIKSCIPRAVRRRTSTSTKNYVLLNKKVAA